MRETTKMTKRMIRKTTTTNIMTRKTATALMRKLKGSTPQVARRSRLHLAHADEEDQDGQGNTDAERIMSRICTMYCHPRRQLLH
jgi:hypothetical protein